MAILREFPRTIFLILALGLWLTGGFRNFQVLVYFSLSLVSALLLFSAPRKLEKLGLLSTSFACLLGFWWLVSLDPHVIYIDPQGSKFISDLAHWLAVLSGACLAFSMFSKFKFENHVGILALWGLVLAGFVIRLFVIAKVPQPFIDVFALTNAASDHLVHGRNPYIQLYPNIYQPTLPPAPAFPYPPAFLLHVIPFRELFGDFRVTYVVLDLISISFIFKLLKNRNWRSNEILAWVAVWCAFPTVFLFTEQAWIDGIGSFWLIVLLWGLDQKKWLLSAVATGLMVSSKQTYFLAWPLVAAWIWPILSKKEQLRFHGTIFCVFLLTLVPVLAQPLVLFDQAFLEVLRWPIRVDSLSWVSFLQRFEGPGLWTRIFLFVPLVGLGIVLVWLSRARRSLSDFVGALTVTFWVTFLFGKQAFLNYYHVVALMAWLWFALGRERTQLVEPSPTA